MRNVRRAAHSPEATRGYATDAGANSRVRYEGASGGNDGMRSVYIKPRASVDYIAWREEWVPERAVEEAIARQPGVCGEVGVPEPARAPTVTPSAVDINSAGAGLVGLREVRSANIAPAIEIVFGFTVEADRLQRATGYNEFLAFADFFGLPVVLDRCFTVDDSHLAFVSVEFIETFLQNGRVGATFHDFESGLFGLIVDFNHRLPAHDFDAGISKRRRNHPHLTVIADAEKRARR